MIDITKLEVAGVIAAWPFANGWMLFWGLAAAAPILIHLWNKRKYREVSWAAMSFLLAAVRRHAQRIRLEQLLLLIVRTAILIFLALALADPVLSLFPRMGTGGTGQGQSHLVVVIDGSYSMGYKDETKQRFDVAKQVAAQWVRRAMQGDGFTLVLMGDQPQRIVAEPAFDANEVIREIEGLEMPHGGANLPATLADVEELIRTAAKKHPRLKNHFVCFITDLDENTWGSMADTDSRQAVARLADSAQLILADVGQTAKANLSVSKAKVRESLVIAGKDVEISAVIENLGTRDVSGRRVEVLVDGTRQIYEETISLAVGAQTSISVSHQFKTAGDHRVHVRLERDDLAVDDDAWCSVTVRESISVLCVEGKHGTAQQVSLALQPDRTAPVIQTAVVPESALLERDLSLFDAIYICNVGRFGSDEAQLLYDYVQGGGTLVFFLGDQVQIENYNEQLGKGARQRLLPVELLGDSRRAQHQFDPLTYQHPMLDAFRGQQGVGLVSTPVSRYVRSRLLSDNDSYAKTVLAFDSGDPAIAEEPIGEGRCILFTTSASEKSQDTSVSPSQPWTYFSLWRSFVPLVHESLAWGLSGRAHQRNVLVNEALQATVRNAQSNSHLDVYSPNRRSERVAVESDGARSHWEFSDTRFSGFYEAKFGPPLSASHWFAVNLNTSESRLRRIATADLPNQFEQTLTIREGDTNAGLPSGRPYYRYVLGVVLMLLLIETFLAWYLGVR